jgi:hypothetical protein
VAWWREESPRVWDTGRLLEVRVRDSFGPNPLPYSQQEQPKESTTPRFFDLLAEPQYNATEHTHDAQCAGCSHLRVFIPPALQLVHQQTVSTVLQALRETCEGEPGSEGSHWLGYRWWGPPC